MEIHLLRESGLKPLLFQLQMKWEYFNFYLSQKVLGGCESDRVNLRVTINSIPAKPVITLDETMYLVSSSIHNTWYNDGLALADTSQRIFPTGSEMVTATSTISGCSSELIEAFNFISTGEIDLGQNEHLGAFPNPFINQIRMDFQLEKTNSLDVVLYDCNGAKVFSKQSMCSGEIINTYNLLSGIYSLVVVNPIKDEIKSFRKKKVK